MPSPSDRIRSAAEIAQRWAQAMRERAKRRPYPSPIMSPWDENTYFQNPVETVLAPPAQPAQLKALSANPLRVAIIFSVNGAGTINFTTLANGANGQGLVVTTQEPTIILRQAELGSIVAGEWFMSAAAGGAQGTAIEILLRDWPNG